MRAQLHHTLVGAGMILTATEIAQRPEKTSKMEESFIGIRNFSEAKAPMDIRSLRLRALRTAFNRYRTASNNQLYNQLYNQLNNQLRISRSLFGAFTCTVPNTGEEISTASQGLSVKKVKAKTVFQNYCSSANSESSPLVASSTVSRHPQPFLQPCVQPASLTTLLSSKRRRLFMTRRKGISTQLISLLALHPPNPPIRR